MKTDDLHGGSFLIIYRGHLYVVQEDFAVFQRPHSFDAVGSGGAQSIASFATMMDFKLVNEIGICEALFKALEVTSKNNITVSGRFDYINTNGERNER